METEMKQKNEEILKLWRQLGFIKGLKEGSINEWRCAKSFDDMVHYVQDDNIDHYAMTTLSFPLIRRILCTGKERLHRIIDPEDIYNFFNETTPLNCIEYVKSVNTKKYKSTIMLRNAFENFLKYDGLGEKSLNEFFDIMAFKKTEQTKLFENMFKDVFDWEAELLAIASDLYVSKNK